jgi:hypothetical protein
MSIQVPSLEEFAPKTFRFYRHGLEVMKASGVPFLVGGAYAFNYYTGIVRHTKDFDLFVRRGDVDRVVDAFTAAGYRAEVVFSHWLAKAFHRDDFVDIIFSSGNGICPVEDSWFEHAEEGEVLGVNVPLMPAEEMIWQKAFIMERERFDGADVNHLIRARGPQLNWDRLLKRFGPNWRVLLSHLVLYGFVYPDDRAAIPPRVVSGLVAQLFEEPAASDGDAPCRGTLLSRMQYLSDTEEWGYQDARLAPHGPMSEEQITSWTNAGR